ATSDRRRGNPLHLDEPIERVDGRDAGTGDRRCASSTIRHEDVAVEAHGVLSKSEIVEHGSNAAADKTLDLLCPSTELRAFPGRARAGRTGKHGVFGREPAFAAPAAPRGNAFLDRSSAEHARRTEVHETRPFGVRRNAPLECNRRQLIGAPPEARWNRVRRHVVARQSMWWIGLESARSP